MSECNHCVHRRLLQDRAETAEEALRQVKDAQAAEVNGEVYTFNLTGRALAHIRKSLKLPPGPAKLALALMHAPANAVLEKDDLHIVVSGEESESLPKVVDVQMAKLRKHLAPYGIVIETVHGVGYRMAEIGKERLRRALELE